MGKITLAEVEYIAFRLAKKLLGIYEPIPDFSTRYPNVLESCIATPFLNFYNKSAYPGLISKASIFFYLMIKNHPFKNGNKRIAVTSLFVLLSKNKKWLKVNYYELYKFTLWIAESPAGLKDEVVKVVEKFIKSHIVNLR